MRIDPNCKACGGTGANSNGRICYPCQKNGEVVEVIEVQPATSPDDDDPALDGF